MRLYRENRIDQPFDMTPTEIAEGFWREKDPEDLGTLDRELRLWIAERGSWDPLEPEEAAAYDEAFDAVLAAWPRNELGETIG